MTEAGRPGCAPWELVQGNVSVFSYWHSDQEGVWHLHGLQKHRIPKPLQLRGWPGAAWVTRREATLVAGPPLGPDLGETSETGLSFLGTPPLPRSSVFHVGGGGGSFSSTPWFFQFLLINLMLQRDV